MAGLDMNFQEEKQICHKAWENAYDNLQIDRFAKLGGVKYTIRNCSKTIYIECTPSADGTFLKKMENISKHLIVCKCCIQLKANDLEKLNELVPLQNQVKALGL